MERLLVLGLWPFHDNLEETEQLLLMERWEHRRAVRRWEGHENGGRLEVMVPLTLNSYHGHRWGGEEGGRWWEYSDWSSVVPGARWPRGGRTIMQGSQRGMVSIIDSRYCFRLHLLVDLRKGRAAGGVVLTGQRQWWAWLGSMYSNLLVLSGPRIATGVTADVGEVRKWKSRVQI